jgi:hypothetical protein
MISFKKYIGEKVELPPKMKNGVSRKDMPQIDGADMGDFLKFLDENGIKHSNKSVDPDTLKATQNQFHIAKVQSIIDKLESGIKKDKRIAVSKDNYVVDGHHNWIAHKNLKMKIAVVVIDLSVKELMATMHKYPKSYTKKLYEEFDLMLDEAEMCPMITQTQLDAFENIVDKLFKKYKIDFDFTRHFRERMGDARNNPCINLKELAGIIQKIYKKKSGGRDMFAKHKDAEAVIKDLQTDLNLPIAIEYNRDSDEFRVAMKTIMRKKNFTSPDPFIRT